MNQAIILITGAIAIWLTQQSNDRWKKYAAPIGLAGQPFWIWSTYQSDQWGMLALSVFYTCTWMLGINNHWIKLKDRTCAVDHGIKPTHPPPPPPRNPRGRGIKKSVKCLCGHNWTCAADEGIKPTEKQLDTGVDGFMDYAKMYCRRCGYVYKTRNS